MKAAARITTADAVGSAHTYSLLVTRAHGYKTPYWSAPHAGHSLGIWWVNVGPLQILVSSKMLRLETHWPACRNVDLWWTRR